MPSNLTAEDIKNMASEVDPNTGLQTEGGSPSASSPLTVEDIHRIKAESGDDSSAYLGEGDFGLDPTEYDFQLRYGVNNDALRADSQSVGGMLAKGAGRLVSTTATKALGGLGYIATALPALASNDMSVMLDNGWSSMFRTLEDDIKDSMPIYKTEKYLKGDVLDQMGTLGFWMDDAIDGAAFMLSSIVGAKGMGALAKGFGAYSKLARGFAAGTRAAQTGEAAEMLTPALKKFVDASTIATISTINSVSEAAFEAKDVKDGLMQSFDRQVKNGLMTQEEANEKASKAAKTTFWTNMAILAPSNFLETRMLFKDSKNLGLNRIFKEGAAANKTGKEIVKDLPIGLTNKETFKAFGKDAILTSMSEGAYEENMQTALQNYTTDRALGKKEDTGLFKGLAENWIENWGTDEGQKSIALGAIIGLIPGGIGGVRSAKSEVANRLRQSTALATAVDMSGSNIKDMFKRKLNRDADGKVTGESEEYLLDENDNPILDTDKMAAVFEKSKSQYLRYVEGLKALHGGNQDAHDFLKNEAFSEYVFTILHGGNDVDMLDSLVDNFVKAETEDLKASGLITEENEEKLQNQFEEQKEAYKKTAKTLNQAYESITNNYAGLADFGNTNAARIYQQGLIAKQYQQASRQIFLTNKKKELELKVLEGKAAGGGTIEGVSGLINVAETTKIQEGLKAAKQLENVEQMLTISKAEMVDLLNNEKQQELFNEEQEILRKESETRGTNTDDDATTASRAATSKFDENRSIRLSNSVSTKTLTPEQAIANGYVEDEERSEIVNVSTAGTNPSYFYKVADDNNSVHIVYTDGTEAGNIISDRTLTGREVINPITGERGRTTLNYLNDKLEKVSTVNLETGETTYLPATSITKKLGREAKPQDSAMVFYNILPNLSGMEYANDPTTKLDVDRLNVEGEELISQKSLDQHRNDVKGELLENISLVAQRTKEDAEKAVEDIRNTNPLPEVENIVAREAFDVQGNHVISGIFNNLKGYVKQEDGSVIFVSTEEDNKEYVLGGSHSNNTFKEMGVQPLALNTIEIVYETDGRLFPIKINGKYYKNTHFAKPSSAVITKNGIPVAVELTDVNGVEHTFTQQHVVQDASLAIEMNEALIDRVFDFKLFNQESDSIVVADPKTGVEYAVYRKDGQYEVYFLREGERSRGYKQVKAESKIYQRVVSETTKSFAEAIGEASKNNYKTEKEIKDGIKSNIQNVRSATPGEALTIPEQHEVSSTKSPSTETSEESKSKVKELNEESNLDIETRRKMSHNGGLALRHKGKTTYSASTIKPNGLANVKSIKADSLQELERKINDYYDNLTESIEEEIEKSVQDKAFVEEEANRRLAEQEVTTAKATELQDKLDRGDIVEPMDDSTDSEEKKAIIRDDSDWQGKNATADTLSYIHFDDTSKQYVVNNGEFLQHVIENPIEGSSVKPDFDYEYRAFWDNFPRLEQTIKNGSFPLEFLDETLSKEVNVDGVSSVEYQEFNTLVDLIPIRYEYSQGATNFPYGIYAHQSNFKYINIPPVLIKDLSPAEANIASQKYRRARMLDMRKTRYTILTQLLKNGSISYPVKSKSVGKFNNVKENAPLGDIISQLGVDPKEQVFGLGLSDGYVNIEGEDLPVASGSKGNVYWYTNNTANGEEIPVKLNPGKITSEHAKIALKALKQLNKGALEDKYVGNEVTGDLTLKDVLKHLTVSGKTNTEVKSNNKSQSKYLQKQLWTTKDGRLIFGTSEMDLHNSSKEIEQSFIDWMTTNKNYPVSKPLLNTTLPKKFTIGSTMKYDPAVDNYSSFILKSNIMNTRIRPVDGTKSITTNPLILIDDSNVTLSDSKGTETVKPGVLKPIMQDSTVKPVQSIEKADPEVIKSTATTNKNASKKTKTIHLLTVNHLAKLPTGTVVYFYSPDVSQEKFKLGEIIDGSKFEITSEDFTGGLATLNRVVSRLGTISTTDRSRMAMLAKELKPFANFVHYDLPQVEVKVIEETNKEIEKEIRKPKEITPEVTDNKYEFSLNTEKFPIVGDVTTIQSDNLDINEQVSLEEFNDYLKEQLGTTEDVLVRDQDVLESTVVNSKVADLQALLDTPKVNDTVEPDAVDTPLNDGFINTGETDFEDIDDGMFRMASDNKSEYKRFNPAKAKKWLRSKLGKVFDIEVIDGLIELANNKHAFGQCRLDSIRLSDAAEIGTEYHEAFHRVSLFLLSDEIRKSIYSQAKSKYDLKDKTDSEIEEVLAEKFRDYMLLREEDHMQKGLVPTIKRFFNRVFNFIKTVFAGKNSLNDLDISRLFKLIDEGRFRFKTINSDKLKQMEGSFANFALQTEEGDKSIKKYETRDTKFDTIQSTEEYAEVIKYTFRQLASASGLIKSVKDASGNKTSLVNLKNGTEDLSKLSYPLLKGRLVSLKNQYNSVAVNNKTPGEEGVAKRAKAVHIKELLEDVINNFGVVKLDLQDYLATLNVKSVDENEGEDIDEDTGETKSDFDNFSKVSFESSSKHNTAADVKLLLSILPDNNQRSSVTGLPLFADFNQVWSMLLRDNLDVRDHAGMMKNLKSKSEGNFPYRKLIEFMEADENLKIKVWNTVNKARLNFISNFIKVDSPGSLEIATGESMINNKTAENIKTWNSNMLRSSKLFDFKQGSNPIPNTEYFNSLRDDYFSLFDDARREKQKTGSISNYTNVAEGLLNLLSSIGINISNTELDVLLNSVDEDQETAILKFMDKDIKFIFSDSGTLYSLFNGLTQGSRIKFENAFNNENNIKNLALAIASLDELSLGNSLLAHAGKRFYLVSQHTNLTNQLNDLIIDTDDFVNTKLKAVHNNNSLILNYFKNNPKQASKLEIKTLASTFRENVGDEGRGYQDVTDVEEYVLRLNANNKGYIVLPTPEARSFYQYLRLSDNAIEQNKLRVPVSINSNLDLNQEAVDIFTNYYLDEVNRIALTKSRIGKAITGDLIGSELIENLEFEFFGDKTVEAGQIVIATDSKGQWIVLPEGARSLHGNGKLLLQDAVIKRDSEGNYVSHSRGKYASRIRGVKHIEFPGKPSKVSVEDYVRIILKGRIEDELKYATELGLIDKMGEEYHNSYIPTSVMDKHRAIVGDNTNLIIRNIIADNTLNTISGGLEMSKLFTSDIASFKGVADYVKRITGYTSTGDNLAVDIPKGVYEQDDLITSNYYNVTTFTSLVLKSELYDSLIEKYVDYYVNNLDWKSGMSESDKIQEATKTAKRKLENFTKVDQTDAQTYITNEMYRAISIKLGEWNDIKENAYKLLTSGKKLEHDQIIEMYNLVSQPLKLTYMKTYQTGGQSYSVFDKMSLATLYRPTVEGTRMEELLDRMELKGKYANKGLKPIHQIKFNTAEKTGVKDRRDIFADETHTDFTDLNLLSVYPQEFRQLRKQLVTDAHDSETIAFGTQVKKVGISNVVPSATYINKFNEKESFKGVELVNEVNEMIGELSNRGAEGFKEEMKLDNNFVVQDKAAIIKTLRREARNSALPQHVIDALKYNEVTDDFDVDLDSMPDARKWFQSRVISLIKKATIDLNLPGGSFIQMTNLGLNKIDKSDELKWNDDEGWIEAHVSVNLFKKIIPDYKNKTHEERVNFLEDNPELVAMGYRVPTQGQNSTLSLRVTKWLPENTGDILVLPKEVTTVTGADFDVDKMYIVRHNYKNGKRIEYLTEDNSDELTRIKAYSEQALKVEISNIRKDYLKKSDIAIEGVEDYEELVKYIKKSSKKSMNLEIDIIKKDWVDSNLKSFKERPILKQNTDKAVQNRLLDLYFTVWHNENHLTHRNQPLGDGASRLKELAYQIYEDLEGHESLDDIPLAYLSPKEQLDVKSRFKFGGAGIGPNALANVHHILSQSVDLGLFTDLGVGNTVDANVSVNESDNDKYSTLTRDDIISEKNEFTVTPDKKVDYKAKSKAKIATKYIGFNEGIEGSSTELYREQVGEFANNKNYTDKDVVFVSIGGKRGFSNIRSANQDRTINLALKALRSGAVILTDNKSYTKKSSYNEGELKLLNRLESDGYAYSEVRIDGDVIGVWKKERTLFSEDGKTTNKKVTTLSALRGKDGEYITEWFSALVDAHVDIAADPWIYYLNANDYTNPTITLLIRAGVGGEETFRFIAQPILKELAKSQQNVGHMLDMNSSPDAIRERSRQAIKDIKKRYENKYTQFGGDVKRLKSTASLKDVLGYQKGLLENISKIGLAKQGTPLEGEFYESQLRVLYAFEKLQPDAANLKEVILGSRVDTKKFGSSVASIKSFENRVLKSLKKTEIGTGIRNFDKLMTDTYLGALSDNAINMSKAVVGSILLEGSPAFNAIHDNILERLGKKYSSNEKFVNKISNYLHSSIVAQFFIKDKSNVFGMTEDDVAKLFRGNTSIPKQIDDIKSGNKWSHLRNNPLFSKKSGIFTRVYKQDSPDFLTINKPDDKYYIDSIVNGWKDLLRDDNVAIQKFAEDLFKYSFFSSGFRNGANSFHNLAPTELLKSTGYDKFIRGIKKEAINPSAFANLFEDTMTSMWTEGDVIPTFNVDNVRLAVLPVKGLGASIVTLPASTFRAGENSANELVGKAYAKSQTGELYKFVGYLNNTDLVYYKVERKGLKDKQFNVVENGFEHPIFSPDKKGLQYKINDDNFMKYATYKLKNGNYLNSVLARVTQTNTSLPIIIHDDGVQTTSSQRTAKELMINPLSKYNLSDEVVSFIENMRSGTVGLTTDLPSGWYTQSNGEIIHIDNSVDGEITLDKSYGMRSPSYSERSKKMEECK